MLQRVEEILKKNDRFYQLDKGLRVFQEVHTGFENGIKAVEAGLPTIQGEKAFATFRRLYTGPVTDAMAELLKASDTMIEELEGIHAKPEQTLNPPLEDLGDESSTLKLPDKRVG